MNTSKQDGFLDRIFFFDLAGNQRTGAFKDPVYACHVAMMMMFVRLGVPLLTAGCVLWMKLERGLPRRYWIEQLTLNQILFGMCIYVIAFYTWLYRRYFPNAYSVNPMFAQAYDTAENSRLAKVSLALAVATPLVAWIVLKV